MFLQLAHTRTAIFEQFQNLALECYKVTKGFPADEKFAMVQQIRRAALSVHLNIAEGASRKSEAERKRYFEIARGSVIEIDAAIGIAFKLEYVHLSRLLLLEQYIVSCFRQLSALIAKGQST